ncbi:unnamed protein product [Hydatigera taeniaeformis]|uniref:Uncharacterized protein n=1 Tax=Hydatigena taeniaeformis TaxID=6205 RepID=A0A0R3WX68_HYDTA|nr:unnamed protein product [Hydatigera taeniaeformis]
MREVNKAMSELRNIADQDRFWSASILPPVPSRPRQHRASIQGESHSE